MATFEPPSAEKLIFSDKTLACLIDCTPTHIHVEMTSQSWIIITAFNVNLLLLLNRPSQSWGFFDALVSPAEILVSDSLTISQKLSLPSLCHSIHLHVKIQPNFQWASDLTLDYDQLILTRQSLKCNDKNTDFILTKQSNDIMTLTRQSRSGFTPVTKLSKMSR